MDIIKIAVAGGPKSGKSSCIASLRDHIHTGKGSCVVILPEAATFCFKNRAEALFIRDDRDLVLRQHYLYACELYGESIAIQTAEAAGVQKLILISDRGILDAAVYLDSAEEILEATGRREVDYTYYDLVMYLLGSFEGESETLRVERDEEETRKVSVKTLSVWKKAPNIVYVPQYPEVEDKAMAVCNAIQSFLGESVFDVNGKEARL